MGQKKWPKPCKFCRGKSRLKCMVCGWKEPKGKTRMADLPLLEQARIRGKRENVDFFHAIDRSSTRAGNCSTQDDVADMHLEEHRDWAYTIYQRIKKGESFKSIADEEELTVSQIQRVYQYTRDKLNRGIFKVYVEPPTIVCHIIEKRFFGEPNRVPIVMEEVDD